MARRLSRKEISPAESGVKTAQNVFGRILEKADPSLGREVVGINDKAGTIAKAEYLTIQLKGEAGESIPSGLIAMSINPFFEGEGIEIHAMRHKTV